MELDAGTLREEADGVGELELVPLHDEVEGVAFEPAAPAAPGAELGVNLEGGVVVVVEGASAPELAPPGTQLHGL